MTTTPPSASQRAAALRRTRLQRAAARLAIFVGIPTIVAIVYYSFIASSQYESTTLFAVTSGRDTSAPPVNTTARGTPKKNNRDFVAEIVRSHAAFETLREKHALVQHFSDSDVDRWSRLSRDAGSEESYRYYLDKLNIEPTPGGIVRLTFRAFSPQKAAEISAAILNFSDENLAKLLASEAPNTTATPREYNTLVTISGPTIPDEATYPKRWWKIATVFFVSLALVGVFSLLIGAVREHARF